MSCCFSCSKLGTCQDVGTSSNWDDCPGYVKANKMLDIQVNCHYCVDDNTGEVFIANCLDHMAMYETFFSEKEANDYSRRVRQNRCENCSWGQNDNCLGFECPKNCY